MPRKLKNPRPPQDPAKRRDMVYAGAVYHDGGLVHAYYFLTAEGALDDRAQLYSEALGDFPPGAQCSYAVHGTGESVTAAGAMFVRIWPDSSVVEEWAARHNAIGASEAAWASKDLPTAFNCLEPIKQAYGRLDEERQGVLLAQVVRYIVGRDDQQ